MRYLLPILMLLGGCAMIPATPVHPIAGQSADMVDRDARECAKNRPYDACMIARGYRVAVQIRDSLTFNIEAARQFAATTVAEDLRSCDDLVDRSAADTETALFGSERAKVATKALVLITLGTQARHPDLTPRLAQMYTDCMTPRGYRTSPWDPSR